MTTRRAVVVERILMILKGAAKAETKVMTQKFTISKNSQEMSSKNE